MSKYRLLLIEYFGVVVTCAFANGYISGGAYNMFSPYYLDTPSDYSSIVSKDS